MTTKTKKHGVIVTVGRQHNTKTIWNRGYRMITYRKQPSRIRFRSKMVNDKNQHLCGGWQLDSLKNTNLQIERQLIGGRKPLGIMCFWADKSAGEARECARRLRAAGLIVKTSNRGDMIDVEACRDIYVGDIGDLGDLICDYVEAGIYDGDDLCREINLNSDRKLKSFLGRRWDTEHNPLWLTGLILGYPVENTISCYHEAVS
jgi:hypothetical protein